MDVYSNMSQVLAKCSPQGEYMSKDTEWELMFTVIKVVRDCKSRKTTKKNDRIATSWKSQRTDAKQGRVQFKGANRQDLNKT